MRHKIGKDLSLLSFAKYNTAYLEIPRVNSTQLRTKKEPSNVADYKVNIQNSILIHCKKNQPLRRHMRKRL